MNHNQFHDSSLDPETSSLTSGNQTSSYKERNTQSFRCSTRYLPACRNKLQYWEWKLFPNVQQRSAAGNMRKGQWEDNL